MPRLSRRELLDSSLAFSATSLLPRVAHGEFELSETVRTADFEAEPASLGRERLLFDFGWKFKLGNSVDPKKDFDYGYGQSDFSKSGTHARTTVASWF